MRKMHEITFCSNASMESVFPFPWCTTRIVISNQLNRMCGWKFNFCVTVQKESKTKCIQKFHSLPKQIDEDHLKYHYNFAYLFVDHAVMGRIHKNCSWVFVPLCALVRILHVVVWALHILESITNKKLTRQKIMTRLDQGKSCDTALNALSNELKRKP